MKIPLQLSLGILLLAACAGARALTITEARFVENPSGRAPLSAQVTFVTDAPATATIFIEAEGRDAVSHEFIGSNDTVHSLPVLGMVPKTAYRVHAEAKDAKGSSAATPYFEMRTPALPADFPPYRVVASRPRQMEPGVTLLPIMQWPVGSQTPRQDFGLAFAINAAGEVVWMYRADHVVGELVRLRNGNLAYEIERTRELVEIDVLGNIIRRWHASALPRENPVPDGSIPIDTDTLHHVFVQMPNENFLLLSTEVRHFDAFPASEFRSPAPTAPAYVVGDVLVEADPAGRVVRRIKLFDLVNPMRIGYDSLASGFYQSTYGKLLSSPPKDWSHTNSVVYDPATNSALLSSRPLDFVYKVDLTNGRLVWILGNHDDWTDAEQKLLLKPIGEGFSWPYHQHAAKWTPQGTVLVYDNGNYRARPGHQRMAPKDSYSRAVEYKVDEDQMTVQQVWSYGEDPADRFFSPFLCDVDWMPNKGNVLITDGGRVADKDGHPSDNLVAGRHWARLLEVSHATPARKLWEVIVDDPATGWSIFRADRVANLYR